MLNMYGIVILSFVFVRLSAGYDIELCKDYGQYLVECCKNEFPTNRVTVPDDISECHSKNLSRCEQDMCESKKMGFATDDGKLDTVKLVHIMFKKVEDDPSLMADVTSKCIKGDFRIYATDKECDPMKFFRCLSMQWLKRCTNWDDSSRCQEFKGFVQECVNFFP
ncbi:uncharacterized protein LOC124630129 [Helicoverpa zea]|uniref:uncharacterized protein LOC124630129 n=1 Tax=Helicoverpa zea TaxID=7113 RepID=UPI001F5840C0|nr:uncharacterized protein LOC124630129 [Helicoverpa zea]